MMSALNVKIDKFTRRNSFSLWQIKMRALLKQQGLWTPLSKKTTDVENAEMAVLEETTSGLWLKLESLYMTKSLTNKLLLKQRLFSLRMPWEDKSKTASTRTSSSTGGGGLLDPQVWT